MTNQGLEANKEAGGKANTKEALLSHGPMGTSEDLFEMCLGHYVKLQQED